MMSMEVQASKDCVFSQWQRGHVRPSLERITPKLEVCIEKLDEKNKQTYTLQSMRVHNHEHELIFLKREIM